MTYVQARSRPVKKSSNAREAASFYIDLVHRPVASNNSLGGGGGGAKDCEASREGGYLRESRGMPPPANF